MITEDMDHINALLSKYHVAQLRRDHRRPRGFDISIPSRATIMFLEDPDGYAHAIEDLKEHRA